MGVSGGLSMGLRIFDLLRDWTTTTATAEQTKLKTKVNRAPSIL
jgi:hypothetical protein